MTPDLRFTTIGRKGESCARIINGMKKKMIQNQEQLFRQATPTTSYSSTVGVFRFKITLSATSRSRRSLPIYIYLLCEQYMAVRVPGHGDLTALLRFRMALSLTIWEPTV